jgi:hypothetical protein
MTMEAAILDPCSHCNSEQKKRCKVMPRGKELDLINERIKAAYPRTVATLSQGLCEKCEHRADHRGCKFGRLPVMECGLFGCKYFRQWGEWRARRELKSKESVINKN